MRNLFRSRPGHEAALYAEAQTLIDDGLPLEEVLALFSKDEAWLRPLLVTTERYEAAIDAEEPSYYFHASLKSRFLEAANERRYRPAPRRESAVATKARTVVASATVLAGTATAGIATFGFVTSDNAVPGDWNYSFKLAQERMEYALATGDDRADVQLHQAQARVYEIQKLTERGDVSEDQIRKLENEAAQLRVQLEKQGPNLNEVQKQQLKNFQDLSTVVLNQAQEKNDRVKPAAQSALNAVTEAVAAGSGGTTVAIPEPTRDPASPTVAPASTTTPVVGVGADPTNPTGAIPDPSAAAGTVTAPPPSETATPTHTATPEPTATSTPTPPPTETATPSPSASATVAPSETRAP